MKEIVTILILGFFYYSSCNAQKKDSTNNITLLDVCHYVQKNLIPKSNFQIDIKTKDSIIVKEFDFESYKPITGVLDTNNYFVLYYDSLNLLTKIKLINKDYKWQKSVFNLFYFDEYIVNVLFVNENVNRNEEILIDGFIIYDKSSKKNYYIGLKPNNVLVDMLIERVFYAKSINVILMLDGKLNPLYQINLEHNEIKSRARFFYEKNELLVSLELPVKSDFSKQRNLDKLSLNKIQELFNLKYKDSKSIILKPKCQVKPYWGCFYKYLSVYIAPR